MLSGATLSALAVRGGVLGPPVRQGLFLLGLGAKAESSIEHLEIGPRLGSLGGDGQVQRIIIIEVSISHPYKCVV
jgi:hypothetical protein